MTFKPGDFGSVQSTIAYAGALSRAEDKEGKRAKLERQARSRAQIAGRHTRAPDSFCACDKPIWNKGQGLCNSCIREEEEKTEEFERRVRAADNIVAMMQKIDELEARVLALENKP